MTAADHPRRRYEIRVSGAIGETLVRAFAGMRAARLEPGALLRIEVAREDWDAGDITAQLRARGHFVRSVRRCEPFCPKDDRDR